MYGGTLTLISFFFSFLRGWLYREEFSFCSVCQTSCSLRIVCTEREREREREVLLTYDWLVGSMTRREAIVVFVETGRNRLFVRMDAREGGGWRERDGRTGDTRRPFYSGAEPCRGRYSHRGIEMVWRWSKSICLNVVHVMFMTVTKRRRGVRAQRGNLYTSHSLVSQYY